MRNMGEACTAANRFHVAASVADEFAEKLAKRMGALKLGPGIEAGVDVGPLVDQPSLEKVGELVEDAVEKGARVVTGGGAPGGRGYFYSPTVLTDVTNDARVQKEEIFGPVAPIMTFDSEEEAIARANDTEFGLVAYVYTAEIKRALRVCEALETGMIGLNQGLVSNPGAPFGGIKASGIGREGGNEGIDDYLETKYVAVNV
jgi:succinate-semialdehyde dehydrogenase/glutarate-semialdehyde dehydrogenase